MSNYEKYVYLQTVKYMSHEDEHSVWKDGQLRFLESITSMMPADGKVLDVGCGDGVSLVKLNELGFSAVGIDFNQQKLDIAASKDCIVKNCDMHDLNIFFHDEFDVIISSHSLEHAYDPEKVLSEFNRILKKDGLLFIVVPFPDVADYAIEAHVGRDILGTSDPIDGKIKIIQLLNKYNFTVSSIKEDSFREPEIWIFAKKLANL